MVTPERFTARALNGHSAVGLTIAALAYLICLTGTLAVFTDELKLLEQPAPAAGMLQPGAIDRAARAVLGQAPETATLHVLAPSTAAGRLTLTGCGPGGEKSWLADASGVIQPMRTPWTEFIDELHMNLTAASARGSLAVGLVGVAMVSLILSGVLAHPRIFYWSLSGPEIQADASRAPMPDLDDIAARARAELPGSTLYYLSVERPKTAGTRIRVEVERAWRGWTRGVPLALGVAWLLSGIANVAAIFWTGIFIDPDPRTAALAPKSGHRHIRVGGNSSVATRTTVITSEEMRMIGGNLQHGGQA